MSFSPAFFHYTSVLASLSIQKSAMAPAQVAIAAAAGTCAAAATSLPHLRDVRSRLGRKVHVLSVGSVEALRGAGPRVAPGNGGGPYMFAKATPYICKDCGYIYNDPRKPFESLSGDYSCPVCQAPKRRFKAYDAPVARNVNDLAVRKARKEEMLKADAAVGSALPALIGLMVVGLIGTAVYLNSQL